MKASTATLAIMTAVLIAWTAIPFDTARAESWTGRATANVNLRAAPGLQGAVITGLVQGTIVQVQEEKDGWIKVAHQNDGFGFQGWVYGQYVQPLEPAPPLIAPRAEGQGDPNRAEAATAPSPPAPAPTRIASAATAASAVPSPAVPAGVSPATSTNATNTPKLQEPSALAPPAVITPSPLPAPAVDRRLADDRSQDILSTKQPSPAAATTVDGAPAPASTVKGVFPWLSLLLRLSTVVLATMALFTANRALQTARAAGGNADRF